MTVPEPVPVPADAPRTAYGIAVEPDTRDRWKALFYALVIVGMVLGFALGVREIVDRPPVRLGDVRLGENADGTVRAQVLARNFSSSTTYCVTVLITAVDGDGLTLAEGTARPTDGEARLGPGQSVNMVTALALTPQQIDEELDDYLAFVSERMAC